LVVERRYVDRDYMEDHSVFYAKSLYPYPNVCRRAHFFKLPPAEVQTRLRALIQGGGQGDAPAYRQACRQFSEENYLGFCVLRPLHGCPVGRTVMRCFPATPESTTDQSRRDFGGTRTYVAHLLGVELTVRGLAFQQQDLGVSACATTAIWSALQKVRDHEDIAAVTPAQITTLASKFSLPFGRAMPSEGLSVDQMCQAIQAVGIAPNIFRISRIEEARGLLHAIIRSELAPVLVLEHKTGGRHAIAVAGGKVRIPARGQPIADATVDRAGDLMAIYIHDDRHGPYLRADLIEDQGGPGLSIPLRPDRATEVWKVTHLLIPMHPKVRLSFSGLRQVALQTVQRVHQFRETTLARLLPGQLPDATVTIENWITRAHKYIESLHLEPPPCPPERVEALCNKVLLARYLGVVRMSSVLFKPLDLLLDTTGTLRNAHALAVVAPGATTPLTGVVARFLGQELGCEAFA
jgi:hypothetical protein